MAWKFNNPPGWPPSPPGWTPPPGWAPDPSWPPAPQGWQFWVPDDETQQFGTSGEPEGRYHEGEAGPEPETVGETGGATPVSPPPGGGPPPGQRQTWPWVAAGAAAIILLICCASAIIGVVRNINEPDGGTSPSPTRTPTPTRTPSPTPATRSPSPATPSPQPTRTGPATPSPPGIGDPARDGNFEFTVREVRCGVQSVGDPVLSKTARGQYCLVTVTVRNLGNQPQPMLDSEQDGVGSNSTQYSTDGEAGVIVNAENNQSFYDEIRPGNQVTGVLVYDIPDNVDLVRLVLHDSLFSRGVEVSLR